MQYHRGLLHHHSHGWGGLLKVAAKVGASIVFEVVGEFLRGAPQTGQGLRGYFDFLFDSGKKIAETFSGPKITVIFKGGQVVIDKKKIPQSGGGFDSFFNGLSRGLAITGNT
jgi:hypothetical protein